MIFIDGQSCRQEQMRSDMQKRTKVILASTAAAIVLAGAVGVSTARESHRFGMMGHGGGHGMASMANKIFDHFDSDGNGAVSKAEVDGVRKSEIKKNDTNKDGKLSLDEFEALWLGYMRERMVDHFQKLDADGDAVVTDAEIAAPLNKMMSWLDRNNDDTLTKDELRRKGHRWGSKKRYYDDDDDDDDDRKKD
jgi:Ca2+-binding EF-hand superfamily protein